MSKGKEGEGGEKGARVMEFGYGIWNPIQKSGIDWDESVILGSENRNIRTCNPVFTARYPESDTLLDNLLT